MATQQIDTEAFARDNLRTAGEAFGSAADFLESLSESDWEATTGCEKWNMRTLADHIAGEAVWFPNLTRNAIRGEDMYPASVYDDMKSWPTDTLIGRLREAAAGFATALDGASVADLDKSVDLGFATQPLWQATYISTMEGVFHGWDTRATLNPDATIPTAWALTLARGIIDVASFVAHRKGIESSTGTYLLQVSDGIGPVTVTARDGQLTVEPGAVGTPDATLALTADQYVRLIVGRLKLDSGRKRDRVSISGDRERAMGLNRIFGGIANEE